MLKNKLLLLISLLALFAVTGCDDNENDNDSQNELTVDFGPEQHQEEYDFYMAMSYSGDQPENSNMKHFYVLFACENPEMQLESVEAIVQGTTIELEYANYGGPDFYIAYFDLEWAYTYHFEVTINGNTTEIDFEMPSELTAVLPLTIEENEEILLTWQIDQNPDVIYIEGFQWNQDMSEMFVNEKEFLAPDIREFNMPADWLWSESEAINRMIQIGIMNYKIQDRICFTVSDGEYRLYN